VEFTVVKGMAYFIGKRSCAVIRPRCLYMGLISNDRAYILRSCLGDKNEKAEIEVPVDEELLKKLRAVDYRPRGARVTLPATKLLREVEGKWKSVAIAPESREVVIYALVGEKEIKVGWAGSDPKAKYLAECAAQHIENYVKEHKSAPSPSTLAFLLSLCIDTNIYAIASPSPELFKAVRKTGGEGK